ncbi:putative methyltransferase DDB_G0268948 [Mangifera indica]|uniref:putative methyltransferase DDB_G0268948 n=1 Tax=Mangifera indica TaxID=29780 RepID=UPI001CFB958A|nr:putative methyltransferase DDB_G0268948 [Mangifera indica]
MAKLFIKQAKQYAETRPSYPPELFQFIASNTPHHHLAWDVGTGSGQAARSLAGIYKNVIATDTSPKQLEYASKLPNIRYQCTSPIMSFSELEQNVANESSVDLVTIAQAMHWFDLPKFYQQVKWVLKKPHGVIAAWCYTAPEVNDSVDAVFQPFYTVDCDPYFEPPRKLVDDKYVNIDFPFEAVDGKENTGPFEFLIEKLMDLDTYFTYLRSWSAYQIAKDKGVELLTDSVVDNFKRAWNEDGHSQKIVRYPIYLRIGKVGNNN